MPKYSLHYFPVRARGELIRLVLTLQGEDFEDKKITQEQWPTEKKNYTFGQLPVLFIDGKQYAESLAIAGYLANKFKLYGSTDDERYRIDHVIGLAGDLFTEKVKGFFEKDPAAQEQKKKEFKSDKVPRFIGHIEKVVSENSTPGYVVGNKLSFGDLAVINIIDQSVDDADLSKYPRLKAIVDNVRANDRLKAYFKNRGEAPI